MSCHKSTLERLQQQGVRLTAQRALILEDLYHNPGHRTAEDIFLHVCERLPGLNRATVYRTLELLRESQVLHTFMNADGITEYELVQAGEHPHHHLCCRCCGSALPLDPGPIEALKRVIHEEYGFHADLEHMAITGLCLACAHPPGEDL